MNATVAPAAQPPAAPASAAADQKLLRCPSCGKPNPDFLDLCQFCNTPLHETPAPSEADDEATPSSGHDVKALATAELPDWLSRLGNPEASPAPAADAPDEAAGKVSSWLDSLRDTEPEQAADNRDWYWTGTNAEPETAQGAGDAAPSAAATSADDVPDWLRSMNTAAPAAGGEVAPGTGELPDWLQSLNAAPAQPEPEQSASPFGTLPDFGAPPIGAPQTSNATSAPAEDLPDWLRSVGETAPPQAAPTAGETTPSTGELPDWLQGFGASPVQPEPEPAISPFGAAEAPPVPAAPAPAEELPDWLQSFGATSAATSAPSAQGQPAAIAPSEELPDWLQGFGNTAPAQPAPVSTPLAPEATPTPAEEMPDWLRSMGMAASSQPAGSAAIAAEPPSAAEDQPPAWVRTPDTSSGRTPATPTEEQPAWLRNVGSTAPTPGTSALIEPAETTDDQPEWLRSLGVTGGLSPSETTLPPIEPTEEQPEWLRALGVTTPLPAGSPGIPPIEPPSEDKPPEWRRTPATSGASSMPPASPAQAVSPFGAAETVSPFAGVSEPAIPDMAATQMPDWLANIQPAKPAGAESGEAHPSAAPGVPLMQGALPSWLEAMRPTEVQRPAIAPEVDNYEETVGILAGLRGVLRAQPGIAQPGKTATRVHKLEISEAEAKQAEALTHVLAEAAEARPVSKRGFRLAVPFQRLAVFGVLLVAIVIPLIIPDAQNIFAPASAWPASAQATFDTLDNLSPAQPALVVFDYDPAQAGELDPLAQALVLHLQRRGVPVVGLSTSPAGAATGETLLAQAFAAYDYGAQYINLGYLPGGPTGILQLTTELNGLAELGGLRSLFTADFRGAYPSADGQYASVWQTPILAQTQKLSDFGVIVLVSASPDTVRTWIEQIRSYTAKPMLVAAVSAGAEPLVRPYYNADPKQTQLLGVLGGILGAAQYETKAGVAGAASLKMWDAVGWGLPAIIVLLIGGNLFYGLAGVRRRKKR